MNPTIEFIITMLALTTLRYISNYIGEWIKADPKRSEKVDAFIQSKPLWNFMNYLGLFYLGTIILFTAVVILGAFEVF